MKRVFIYFSCLPFLLFLGFGCSTNEKNFISMTKEEVAAELELGYRMKNGCFRVKYPISSSPPDTLVHHFHKNKESLLNDSNAMSARQWQVYFHLDRNMKWHSYLLDFEDNVVVRQSDRWQPHWTMAE